MEDEPSEIEYDFPELPPGAMYDADHQCRLIFGPGATYCHGIEMVCRTLWCKIDNRCITRLEPAAEGTQCGKHKVKWREISSVKLMTYLALKYTNLNKNITFLTTFKTIVSMIKVINL